MNYMIFKKQVKSVYASARFAVDSWIYMGVNVDLSTALHGLLKILLCGFTVITCIYEKLPKPHNSFSNAITDGRNLNFLTVLNCSIV